MSRTLGLGLALLAGIGDGRAFAMTSDPAGPVVHCSVEPAGKLPSGLTADAICTAIRKAVTPALAGSTDAAEPLSVEVAVQSASKLVATARLGNRTLPEHRIAISDHPLNASSVQMLANAIAADIVSVRK